MEPAASGSWDRDTEVTAAPTLLSLLMVQLQNTANNLICKAFESEFCFSSLCWLSLPTFGKCEGSTPCGLEESCCKNVSLWEDDQNYWWSIMLKDLHVDSEMLFWTWFSPGTVRRCSCHFQWLHLFGRGAQRERITSVSFCYFSGWCICPKWSYLNCAIVQRFTMFWCKMSATYLKLLNLRHVYKRMLEFFSLVWGGDRTATSTLQKSLRVYPKAAGEDNKLVTSNYSWNQKITCIK